MRIGINGRLLLREKTGVGTYTESLYRHLREVLSEGEVILYNDERENRPLYPPLQKIKRRWIRKPLYLLWLNFLFPPLLRRDKIDLLHSPNFTPPLHLKIKSVVTFHDMVFFKFPEVRESYLYWKYSVKVTPLLAKVADRIIAISESAKRDILECLPVEEEKIDVVYEGVEDFFRPIYDPEKLRSCRRRYKLPPKFILFVGAIDPRKNLISLIRAYSSVLKIYPQLDKKGKRVRESLENIFKESKIPVKCTGCGSLFKINFPFQRGVSLKNPHDVDYLTDTDKRDKEFRLRMIIKGVHIYRGGGALSTAHTSEDIKKIISCSKEAIGEMERSNIM